MYVSCTANKKEGVSRYLSRASKIRSRWVLWYSTQCAALLAPTTMWSFKQTRVLAYLRPRYPHVCCLVFFRSNPCGIVFGTNMTLMWSHFPEILALSETVNQRSFVSKIWLPPVVLRRKERKLLPVKVLFLMATSYRSWRIWVRLHWKQYLNLKSSSKDWPVLTVGSCGVWWRHGHRAYFTGNSSCVVRYAHERSI